MKRKILRNKARMLMHREGRRHINRVRFDTKGIKYPSLFQAHWRTYAGRTV